LTFWESGDCHPRRPCPYPPAGTPFAEPLGVRVSTDTCKQVARVWLPDCLPI
jgi:hypothetical protein